MPSGTRELLIEVAANLLDAGGVDAVTLREVGHRAGVSHNAPYKHFPSKESLLAAVAARELARMSERQRQAPADGDARLRLAALLHGYLTWAMAHPARFKLVFSAWTTASAELAEQAEAAASTLVEAVAAAQRAGVLPVGDPQRLASLLRSLAHGAVDLALSGHLAADGKGRADPAMLVDDLLKYLESAV